MIVSKESSDYFVYQSRIYVVIVNTLSAVI